MRLINWKNAIKMSLSRNLYCWGKNYITLSLYGSHLILKNVLSGNFVIQNLMDLGIVTQVFEMLFLTLNMVQLQTIFFTYNWVFDVMNFLLFKYLLNYKLKFTACCPFFMKVMTSVVTFWLNVEDRIMSISILSCSHFYFQHNLTLL